MSELKTIASFSFAHEAHLAKSKLEASSIPAFIKDEHTITMNWLYSNALGGVKLQVLEDQDGEAIDILRADFSKDIDAVFGSTTRVCPDCGGEDYCSYTKGKKSAFMTALLLGFPLILCQHGFKCNNCDRFWLE